MNPNLARLVELQSIDLQIHELDMSSEHFPEQVEKLETEIAEARTAIEELRSRITETDQEKSSCETAVEEARQALERSQTRLTSITTNREYDAVHTEIEANQSAMTNGKARIDTLTEDHTRLEQSLNEAQERLESLENDNGPQIEELKGKIAAIDGQRNELLTKRQAVVTDLSPQYIRAYEHISKRRKSGKVLSMVTNDSRTCSVCHKVLEPQVVNELRAGRRLNICQSCGSILIWEEDVPAEEDAAGSEE